MTDAVDTLLIDVRASTQGFAQDVAAMRSTFDGTLVSGFSRAGDVLERGLLGALRRGSLGFDDLKRVALSTMSEIAAGSLKDLFGGGSGAAGGSGLLNGLGSLLGAVVGLPGRATGGPVAPGSAYIVGERGPEVFVPSSAVASTTGGSEPPAPTARGMSESRSTSSRHRVPARRRACSGRAAKSPARCAAP